MQYHVKTIKSSIIFDNHGNNWADDKPFFEVGVNFQFKFHLIHFFAEVSTLDGPTFYPYLDI